MLIVVFYQVHESDTAGHGHEDGKSGRKPWHEAWHAAWHGRPGKVIKVTLGMDPDKDFILYILCRR